MKIKNKIISITIMLVLLTSILIATVYANKQEKIYGGLIEDFYEESQKLIKNNTSIESLMLNNESINLEYQYSLENNSQNIDVYEDSDNTQYILNNNSLVGFIKNIDSNNNISTIFSVSQGEILDIALEFLSNNLEHFEEYELMSINYIETYNEYCITYMNKCSGYKTLDVAEINVNSNGEIVSYYANNQGLLAQYENSIITVDQQLINQFISEQINSKFGNINTYNIEDNILTLVNNRLAMQYYIGLELVGGYNSSEIVVCYID